MSVILKIISSISPQFPAYRFFADDFKNQASKDSLYVNLAQLAVKYISFLRIPGASVHLVLERQTGGKVTADERSRRRAATTNNGLDLIFSCKSHGSSSQGKELINQGSSFSQFDQSEIVKRILQLQPGILFLIPTLISIDFNACVCRGEADSGIVDIVEHIKAENPTAIAVVCSSDSDFLYMPEIGRDEMLPDLIDFMIVPQSKYEYLYLLTPTPCAE
jgi:hypothetical protein